MSDFLTRLAERTLGVAPVARPDLKPIFAPESRSSDWSPVAELVPGSPARVAERRGPSSIPLRNTIDEPRAERSVPQLEFFAQQVDRRLVEMQMPSVQVTAAMAEPASRAVSPSAQPIGIEATELVAREGGVENRPHDIVPAEARSALDTQLRPIEPHPPSINITIGRVEVRAMRQPMPARVSENRPSPALTLDQYLRERNKGRR